MLRWAMANNLFVLFQLRGVERDGAEKEITRAIEGLGAALRLHETLWLIDSSCSVGDAAERVRAAMTADDCLVVVDSSNDRLAWFNLDDRTISSLGHVWNGEMPGAMTTRNLRS